MRATSKPISNIAGVSLGELIDFCAQCVALGIPESTKLRAFTDSQTALLSVLAETPPPSPWEIFELSGGEDGVVIDGGVTIQIPEED
jgi:hypothetical protein